MYDQSCFLISVFLTNLFIGDFMRKLYIPSFSLLILGILYLPPVFGMEKDDNDIDPQSFNILKDEVKENPNLLLNDSRFQYDLRYLNKALHVVDKSQFLSQEHKDLFTTYSKRYDKNQFLKFFILNEEEQDYFLINLDPRYNLEEFLKCSKNEEEKKIKIKFLSDSFFRKKYNTCIDNIKSSIKKNGRFNTILFDAFFYDVLGVPYVKKEEYLQKDIKKLLKELKKIEFLKNTDVNSIVSLRKTYDPAHELEKFYKKYEKNPLSLVIGDGHKGLTGIESISQYSYGDVLTIDIRPFMIADITSDINHPGLLKKLNEYYKEHFEFIYDTTSMAIDYNSDVSLNKNDHLFKEDNLNYVISLLRPGGQFKQTGTMDLYIRPHTEELLTSKYGFKPIFSDERVIALEKVQNK